MVSYYFLKLHKLCHAQCLSQLIDLLAISSHQHIAQKEQFRQVQMRLPRLDSVHHSM